MFTWNNPYVLAVVLGLIAALYSYFEQKQKGEEVDLGSCGKLFFLTSGLIVTFHFLAANGAVASVKQTGGAPSVTGLNNLKIQHGLPDF